MNEKIVNIAFTLASNRGAYAILLGSGVSRAAGIPTGWEITLDLIKKYAQRIDGEDITNPEEWYRTKFHEEPDYSDVLNRIFKTPTERSRAIKEYIEPKHTETGESKMVEPTKAHIAIARLVKMGVVKVIITTNFDRLMENALDELKITPQVITNADDIRGSVPLSHSDSTLIKINGDYLDTRTKNTVSELNQYNRNLKKLLTGIVNDYGLIICGWSGEWDKSLVDCLLAKCSKRYWMYWVIKSDNLAEPAKKIIDHQNADFIPNMTADEFFTDLSDSVTVIVEKRQTNPLSIEIAIELTKKYLAEDKYYIKLHDLIMYETKELIRSTISVEFRIDVPWSDEEFNRRVASYEVKCEMLMNILVTCSYWGGSEINKMVGKSFEMLINSKLEGHESNVYSRLWDYPTLYILYAVLISALYNNNLHLFKVLLVDCKRHNKFRTRSLAMEVNVYQVFQQKTGGFLPGQDQRKYTPVSEYLHGKLLPKLTPLIFVENSYQAIFDRMEYYYALICASINENTENYFWAPVGSFGWRNKHSYANKSIQKMVTDELNVMLSNHPLLKAGLFNSSLGNLIECNKKLSDFVDNLGWY